MSFRWAWELEHHEREEHPYLYRCFECESEGNSINNLEDHALKTGHATFLCPEGGCGSTFSRYDVMKRHYLNHTADAQRFPRPHCKMYRGKNGFKRKDHLTQHLRGYHHAGEDKSGLRYGERSCPHEDCSANRGRVDRDGTSCSLHNHAFKKISDWTAHMKGVHDESLFPCTIPGCDRTGGKGYFRQRDLTKHISKLHSDHADES